MITKNKHIALLIIFLSILTYPQIGLSQFNIIEIPAASTELRIGSILQNNSYLNFTTNARFIPFFSRYGLDEWTSNRMTYSIDGILYKTFPFNTVSVDLVPLDLIQLDKIEISLNQINLVRRKIEDSLMISARIFTGSETGDPLIHNFTRDNLTQGNQNKIVPSVVISLSNTLSPISYRITSGYFGYYNTGSKYDDILYNLNRSYVPRQNKQAFGSAEIDYQIKSNRKISLYSAFLSYYGWDIIPFINSFAHIESYTHTIRLSYINLFDNFTINIRKDGNDNELHKMYLTPASNFSLSDYALSLLWSVSGPDKNIYDIKAEINYQTGFNTNKNKTETQNIFDNNIAKWSYNLSASTHYKIYKSLISFFKIKYENHFVSTNISGETKLRFMLDKSNIFEAAGYSNVRFPNITELHGNFTTFRKLSYSSMLDTFTIKGNPNLIEERINNINISFQHDNRKLNFFFRTEIFAQTIYNPITQKIINIFRPDYPGDIVRNSVYINDTKREMIGANFEISKTLFNSFELKATYGFIENRNVPQTPKNKYSLYAGILLPSKTKVATIFNYQSKTFWKEYILDKMNDEFSCQGINGTVPAVKTVNLSIHQQLSKFYFFRNVEISFKIENVFNDDNYYFPMGNQINRTFLFSIFITN